jgi:hypothetical protein
METDEQAGLKEQAEQTVRRAEAAEEIVSRLQAREDELLREVASLRAALDKERASLREDALTAIASVAFDAGAGKVENTGMAVLLEVARRLGLGARL